MPIFAKPWMLIVAPIVIVLIEGVIKCIVAKDGFKWSHFYLSIDLILTAMASSLVNACSIARRIYSVHSAPALITNKDFVDFNYSIGLFLLALILLFLAIAFHTDFERKSIYEDSKGKMVLGIIWNGIGVYMVYLFEQVFMSI